MIRMIVLDVVLLALSMAATAGAMLYSSGGTWSEEMMLPLVPYATFFVAQALVYLVNPLRRPVVWSGCITSFLVLLFTVLVYGGVVFGRSSTGPIVFMVAPFYLLFGAPLVFLGGVFIGCVVFRRHRSTEDLRCAKCGYLLIGLREARCPECAEPFSCDLLDTLNATATRRGQGS